MPHTLLAHTPPWLPDLGCRSQDTQPTSSGQPRGTTTETDEDEIDDDVGRRKRSQTKTAVDENGGRRRWRHTKTKTKTDALWGRPKWQLSISWRYPRFTKTETDEEEDRATLGSSEVAVTVQLTTSQTHEDGARRRRRQSHSGVKRSDSSLTVDDTPDLRRRNLIRPCRLVPKLTFMKTKG